MVLFGLELLSMVLCAKWKTARPLGFFSPGVDESMSRMRTSTVEAPSPRLVASASQSLGKGQERSLASDRPKARAGSAAAPARARVRGVATAVLGRSEIGRAHV